MSGASLPFVARPGVPAVVSQRTFAGTSTASLYVPICDATPMSCTLLLMPLLRVRRSFGERTEECRRLAGDSPAMLRKRSKHRSIPPPREGSSDAAALKSFGASQPARAPHQGLIEPDILCRHPPRREAPLESRAHLAAIKLA